MVLLTRRRCGSMIMVTIGNSCKVYYIFMQRLEISERVGYLILYSMHYSILAVGHTY